MIILSIGIVGMALILLCFLMNQFHNWKDTSLKYDVINTIGSLLLVVYAFLIKSYPFLILNFVWFVVSFRDCFIDIKK